MVEDDRKEMIGEDWKKEYEKVILSRKYFYASTTVSDFFINPNENTVKMAFASVMDFVVSMPVSANKTLKENRDKFKDELDDIGLVLLGDPSFSNVTKLYKKYGIIVRKVREGVRIRNMLTNLPELGKSIRNILIECGDFATQSGLRITLAKPKDYGMEKIENEEGMENLNIDGLEEE